MTANSVPVSVVIPCYRCTQTVDRAFSSVCSQTVMPSEVIFVDDFSADGTLDKLFHIQKQMPDGFVKVISLPSNAGPASARNAGWSAAMHPYVAFLDSDDGWHPQKIEIQYAFMSSNPLVDIVGHNSKLWDGSIREVVSVGDRALKRMSKLSFLFSNKYPTRSVMLKRDIPLRFEEGKRYSEDYLLWLRILLNGYLCYKLDHSLAFSYKEDFGVSGLSANLSQMQRGQINTYTKLYDEKLINIFIYTACIIFSYVRYVRRILISYLRVMRGV